MILNGCCSYYSGAGSRGHWFRYLVGGLDVDVDHLKVFLLFVFGEHLAVKYFQRLAMLKAEVFHSSMYFRLHWLEYVLAMNPKEIKRKIRVKTFS